MSPPSPEAVLVTGASGLLGRAVLREFKRTGWPTTGTGLSRASPPEILKVDLNDQAALEEALDQVRPRVVVHCAANRFPDKCEADPTGARAINIDASASLASACSARGSLLIYISTDYVFPGVPGHAPYEADAEPAPTNLYGQTKLDGEKAVLSTMEKEDGKGVGVVLRVPVLYGEADQPSDSAVNVLMDAVWKAQDKDASISMDDWALRYPTNTEDVARVCVDIAAEYTQPGVDARSLPKILQFSSEHRVTKYQICQIFADIMGLSLDGMKGNKEGNDPKAAVQRPYDTHLSTRALRELGIHTNCMDFEGWWRREVRAFKK